MFLHINFSQLCLTRTLNNQPSTINWFNLWLQIKRCLAAPRVERHRDMFVRDVPPAVDLAVAKSCADPHIDVPAVRFRSAEVTEIVRERDVVTRCDGQLANFTFNRALP